MAFFSSFKKYPTPVAKPLWPFFAGAVVVTYFVGLGAKALMNSSEFINDPRHPRFVSGGKIQKEEH